MAIDPWGSNERWRPAPLGSNEEPDRGQRKGDVSGWVARSNEAPSGAPLAFRRGACIVSRCDPAFGPIAGQAWDAKYNYWFIRPTQADPMITLAIPLPSHPSYPSGHSCISGSSTGVLMAAFPNERKRLEAVALEASLSRLYGGLRYRFDMVAGLALGRGVAAKAVAADLDGIAVR
jgi:membrane-associated phospholipid phosphatase